MIEFVEKALNVRRNEFGPAFLLFAYLFSAIGAYYIAGSVGDAMFLSAYGKENLPYVIIATAVVVGTFASIYIRLSNRMRVQHLMFGALTFFAVTFGLFWWVTSLHVKLVYGAIYVWTYILGAIAPTIGWTMANFVLTTREARRIFGFVGAGGALGAPCAAFLTAGLIHRKIVRPETMLLAVVIGAQALHGDGRFDHPGRPEFLRLAQEFRSDLEVHPNLTIPGSDYRLDRGRLRDNHPDRLPIQGDC